MQEHAFLPRGSKLPRVRLTTSADESEAPLVAGRGPVIVAVAHSAQCAGCRRYVQDLAEASPAFAEWGGRLAVVVPGPGAAARAFAEDLPHSTRVLADPHARLSAWGPSLMVVDEWGEVFFAAGITDAHELPSAQELADWAGYVAIQCEECEMPEGGWKAL